MRCVTRCSHQDIAGLPCREPSGLPAQTATVCGVLSASGHKKASCFQCRPPCIISHPKSMPTAQLCPTLELCCGALVGEHPCQRLAGCHTGGACAAAPLTCHAGCTQWGSCQTLPHPQRAPAGANGTNRGSSTTHEERSASSRPAAALIACLRHVCRMCVAEYTFLVEVLLWGCDTQGTPVPVVRLAMPEMAACAMHCNFNLFLLRSAPPPHQRTRLRFGNRDNR